MPLTLAQVFEAAIAAEGTAEQLFRALQAGFAAHPDLNEYWGRFAQDEVQHAAWLTELCARLSTDRLAEEVDEQTAHQVQAVARFSVAQALRRVADLEDAYELANEIESAETNALFRFLVEHCAPDEQMCDFLRRQLDRHVSGLLYHLPEPYQGVLNRRNVKLRAQ